jgi:hypothetical protein
MSAAEPDEDPHAEYLRFLERVKPGAPLGEDDWLFHFDHQNRDAASGPAAGAEAPDFSLPDHTGTIRSRGDLTDRRGMLLVFARSADW